ncbi:MAG: hypothetical protein J5615_04290 [Fibrobacter sp.]|nr:hypothetical protein [Fibrobacter sp.]
MFVKKLMLPLLCASLMGMVACGDESSDHSNSNPVVPPSPTSSADPAIIPGLSSAIVPTPTSESNVTPPPSGDYAALATTKNAAAPVTLFDSWKSAHFATIESDMGTYPSIANDFTEIFTSAYLPAGRVIWQSSYAYAKCKVDDATNRLLKSRACTVSEGIGYGMLLSFFRGDDDAFLRLWNYNRAFRDYNGGNLMPWIVRSFSYDIIDKGSATDADLDIATSLILMYYRTKLEPYKTDALAIINDLWKNEIEPNSKLILSGNTSMWNGTGKYEITYNLSYFSPVALRLFALVDPSHDWNGVLDAMYTYMAKVQDGGTGVFPDWSNAAGVAIAAPNGSADDTYFRFDKESVRIPWRIAWDYYWYQDPRAAAVLNKLNKFIVDKASGDVKSLALGTSYSWNLSLGVDETSNVVAGMWLGAWCSTGIAGNSTWLNSCTTEFNTKELSNSTASYFTDILLVMYSQLLNGAFVKPF